MGKKWVLRNSQKADGKLYPIVLFEGIPEFLPSAPTTHSFWASNNNCSPDSIVTELPDLVTTDNSTVTLIEYTGCHEDTEVLSYRVNNGGHGWPGTGPNISILRSTNRDINASSEIWNFFSRNPLPMPTGVADNRKNAPGTFQLFQNYPNPFNPETLINYHLTAASHVALRIYNQLGQLVRILEDAARPAGAHQVVWDGNDGRGTTMPSGLYFYRLKTGSLVQTRKMLLVR